MTSFIAPRAFTPERLVNESMRPKSAAYSASVPSGATSGTVVAPPRRPGVGNQSVTDAGGSPSNTTAATRKYRVIADDNGDEEDDDFDDDDDGEEDESYDEAEEASVNGSLTMSKKTPPERPPAPNFTSSTPSSAPTKSSSKAPSSSSAFDGFLPPKMESLDLFQDPDILGLLDGDSRSCSKPSAENSSSSTTLSSLIPHIPAPVPPPRRKRTGSSVMSDAIADLPADCVPGRPGEPPVSIGNSNNVDDSNATGEQEVEDNFGPTFYFNIHSLP